MPLHANNLANIPFFKEVEAKHLQILATQALSLNVVPEQVVFLEGETSQGLYVVEDGWLKGTKIIQSGREQVLRYFGPGETINEVGLFLDAPNPATLIALEDSRVWLIPRQVVLNLMESNSKFMHSMTRNLAQRLLYVVSLVEDLSLLSVEARFAKFLLEQAEDDIFIRRRWATQAELASRLGTVPDVLHRVLRSFSEAGIIEVQRQQIIILNRADLEEKTKLA